MRTHSGKCRFCADRLMIAVSLLLPLLAFTTSSPGHVVAQESSDVTMFRGNAARTGEMPGPAPVDEPSEIWSFKGGCGLGAVGTPAVQDGVVYFGSGQEVCAVDVASGTEQWRFATGSGVSSSPAVADGVVFVGSWDGNLYAIDAASGTEQWRSATGDRVSSSPAVADGVVFLGGGDGNHYAIGEPDPELRAEQNREIVAQQQASDQAIALVWATIQSDSLPIGIIDPLPIRGWFDEQSGAVREGALASEVVLFSVQANSAALGGLAYLLYGSVDEAHAAFDTAPQVLLRGGWQLREPTGIDHNATCLTLQSAGSSEAVCYVSRDKVVIATYSILPLDAIDAAFLNANDLARFASDIYDDVTA